ncbi:hypothetical protein [Limibacillus halophilus]
MEQLEHPREEDWEERRLWFEGEQQRAASGGLSKVSEQAAALLIELQCVYCAGAWAASVLLAAAIVDAQSLYAGFPSDSLSEERNWLRGLRNGLLHEYRSAPALTIEDHWTKRDAWRRDAKRAVRLALANVYGVSGRKGERG